jgi:hypothetical protein
LTSIPLSLKEKSELVKESEAQIKAYSKVMQDKKDRLDYEMWKVAATIEGADYIKQYNRADLKTIEVFLQRLEFNDVIDAAELAYSRFVNDDYSKFKYFCGICWNRIKGDNHG